jgi:predicted O-methyltransferase YrrM
MSSPPEQEYRQQLLDLMRGYRQAQLLISCAELGVFMALHPGPAPADRLAAQLGVRAAALSRLLNAAVAIGLLELRDGQYANSPLAAACLAAEGPYHLGYLVRREGAFYRRWSHLAEAVRTGNRPEENRRDEDESSWVRDFEYALYDAARTAAPAVAEALAATLPAGDHALRAIDIGGGHGAYSIALARRCPQLVVELFELPAVVPVAQEIVAAAGAAERVQVREGDFKRDPLGEKYDLALLFGVLVSETPDDSIALLHKVWAALRPGGAVVIRGLYLDDGRAGPLDAVLADLHMLLSTDAGGIQTLAELHSWLAAAGFGPPDRLALPPPERSSLIIARRPA